MSQFSPHRPRHAVRFAVAAASIGAAALAFGPMAASAATGDNGGQSVSDTTVLQLNSSATAEVGTDCPTDGRAYWHFVVTPNNGTISFESITLNLDGTQVDFSGSQIVPNGGQMDNVFIAVPDGYTLDSLVKTGTSATVSGDVQASSNFNLSHVCEGTVGGGGGTTTTTVMGGGEGGGGTTTTTVTGGGGGGTTPTTGGVEGVTVNRGGGTMPSAQVQGMTQTRGAVAATAVQSGARYTG